MGREFKSEPPSPRSVGDASGRYRTQLEHLGPAAAKLLERVPLQTGSPLPANWLRTEMLERFQVLDQSPVASGSKVLEIGAGPHAIATAPLAHRGGAHGRLVAVERERWAHFHEIMEATGMEGRVRPVRCDARRLPFPPDTFDLAACIHGIRSLRAERIMVEVFREMLRVAPRLLLAESLPLARTDAQAAHLALYELRQEVFMAVTGRPDDLHYLSLQRLVELVEEAGGSVMESSVIEVDLPHALALLPRSYIEQARDPEIRVDLIRRWDRAMALAQKHGTDHPPVGMVTASR